MNNMVIYLTSSRKTFINSNSFKIKIYIRKQENNCLYKYKVVIYLVFSRMALKTINDQKFSTFLFLLISKQNYLTPFSNKINSFVTDINMRHLPLILLICLLALSRCERNSVHVLSQFSQPITSSILSWVAMTKDQKIPQHAVMGAVENAVEDPLRTAYVCRVQLEGMWLSGQLRSEEMKCVVSMHGSIYK